MPVRPHLRLLVPLIVACALFLENLDSTVIATALPQIAASLGEDPLRLNLAITSYLLSLAVFIPLSGWVADRFGARRVFRAAIVIFTLGSVCCGVSNALPELIGVGTGALLLHLTLLLHGRTALSAGDFAPAFLAITPISLASLFFFMPLAPQAGVEVSGHRARSFPRGKPAPAPHDRPPPTC
jgi:MFS family permease